MASSGIIKKPSEENPGKEKRAEDRQRGTRCWMKGYRRHDDWVKVVHQGGPAGASSAVCAVCVMLNEYMRGEAGEEKKKRKARATVFFKRSRVGEPASLRRGRLI